MCLRLLPRKSVDWGAAFLWGRDVEAGAHSCWKERPGHRRDVASPCEYLAFESNAARLLRVPLARPGAKPPLLAAVANQSGDDA